MDQQTVRRVDLPSGGWWEIETRPRWEHVREWTAPDKDTRHGSEGIDAVNADLADWALISLTAGWSFDDDPTLESLARRAAGDVIAAMEVLEETLERLGAMAGARHLAERLFEGLMGGCVPDEFAEAHLLAMTGWSFRELQETPADVAEKVAIYLAVKQAIESGGDLEFPEEANDE